MGQNRITDLSSLIVRRTRGEGRDRRRREGCLLAYVATAKKKRRQLPTPFTAYYLSGTIATFITSTRLEQARATMQPWITCAYFFPPAPAPASDFVPPLPLPEALALRSPAACVRAAKPLEDMSPPFFAYGSAFSGRRRSRGTMAEQHVPVRPGFSRHLLWSSDAEACWR